MIIKGFSETFEPFDNKLGWKVPCVVLFQMSIVTCMLATIVENCKIGPYGKMGGGIILTY
jgi:hypothetical protein